MGVVRKAKGLTSRRRQTVRGELVVPRGSIQVPLALRRLSIPRPQFPPALISISHFGAVPDDTTDCTAAIAAAINACVRAGGGRVLIPAGRWFCGPIHLQSNIDLHLAAEAQLRFSDDPQRYLPAVPVRWCGLDCLNYSPLIYARHCRNVAITGPGALLGQGNKWWDWHKLEPRSRDALYQMARADAPLDCRRFGTSAQPLRPQMILFHECSQVLLEDFTIDEGGPFWGVHLAYSDTALIRGLKIDTAIGPNNDGIVIDSCHDVLVEDCDISAKADCVCIKSGANEDGWRMARPTQNVVIRRVRGAAGTAGFSIGSEMSGDVRNLWVHHCEFDGPETGVRLKSARGRGGIVEQIFIEDLTMTRIAADALHIATDHSTMSSPDGRAPTFRDIVIRNIIAESLGSAGRLSGLSDRALENLLLENLSLTAPAGLQLNCVRGAELRGVKIHPTIGPLLSIRDGQDVLIDGLYNGEGRHVFLDLRGRNTRAVRLRGAGREGARPAVVLGIDVPRDALLHL